MQIDPTTEMGIQAPLQLEGPPTTEDMEGVMDGPPPRTPSPSSPPGNQPQGLHEPLDPPPLPLGIEDVGLSQRGSRNSLTMSSLVPYGQSGLQITFHPFKESKRISIHSS